MRSHPAKHGEGFDAPPTLERSGSEHRRAVTSFLLRFLSPIRGTEGVVKTIEKAWLEVELPLAKDFANERNESLLSNCRVQLILSKGRRRDSKDSFLVTGNLKHFPKEPQVITAAEMMEILDNEL